MDNFTKGVIVTILIIYIVSPVDFFPGPVDDVIALLIGLASLKGGD